MAIKVKTRRLTQKRKIWPRAKIKRLSKRTKGTKRVMKTNKATKIR